VKSEINVTPLVDVVLVLLIIFMVVAPMLQRAKAVELPKSAHVDHAELDEEPLMVAITSDGRVWLGDHVIDGDLETRVRAELKTSPARQILIKGDARLTVGQVRQVMQRIRTAGAKGVGLSVEEVKREQ
jgi:biopolymer transport protein ExbD